MYEINRDFHLSCSSVVLLTRIEIGMNVKNLCFHWKKKDSPKEWEEEEKQEDLVGELMMLVLENKIENLILSSSSSSENFGERFSTFITDSHVEEQ